MTVERRLATIETELGKALVKLDRAIADVETLTNQRDELRTFVEAMTAQLEQRMGTALVNLDQSVWARCDQLSRRSDQNEEAIGKVNQCLMTIQTANKVRKAMMAPYVQLGVAIAGGLLLVALGVMQAVILYKMGIN